MKNGKYGRRNGNIWKKAAVLMSLALCLGAGSVLPVQAYFKNPLAADSRYRPVNFGMGYEVYVDLSRLETIPGQGGNWVFKVPMFNSKEDSGQIEGTYTITYKIDRSREAWVYDEGTHSWQAVPMSKRIQHSQMADYVAVNLCYKAKTGKYLYDAGQYAQAMERYYRGPAVMPAVGDVP